MTQLTTARMGIFNYSFNTFLTINLGLIICFLPRRLMVLILEFFFNGELLFSLILEIRPTNIT
jgi:hypothetical protein